MKLNILILLILLNFKFIESTNAIFKSVIRNSNSKSVGISFSGTGADQNKNVNIKFNGITGTIVNVDSQTNDIGSWQFPSPPIKFFPFTSTKFIPLIQLVITIPISNPAFISNSFLSFNSLANETGFLQFNNPNFMINDLVLTKKFSFNFSGNSTVINGTAGQNIGNISIDQKTIPIFLNEDLKSWSLKKNIILEPGKYTLNINFNVNISLDPVFNIEISVNCVTDPLSDPPFDNLTNVLIEKYRNSDQPVNPRIGCCS